MTLCWLSFLCTQTLSGLNLVKSYVCCHSLCLENDLSLEILTIHSHNLSASTLHRSLSLRDRNLLKTSHLELGTLKYLIPSISSSWKSVLISSAARKSFSDENWVMKWPMDIAYVIRSCFISIFIPIGTMNYLVSGSWPYPQCYTWVSAHAMDLKSNKIVISNSHTILPPLKW